MPPSCAFRLGSRSRDKASKAPVHCRNSGRPATAAAGARRGAAAAPAADGPGNSCGSWSGVAVPAQTAVLRLKPSSATVPSSALRTLRPRTRTRTASRLRSSSLWLSLSLSLSTFGAEAPRWKTWTKQQHLLTRVIEREASAVHWRGCQNEFPSVAICGEAVESLSMHF